MSNVEKLKKKAAEFEQKKQFDKALEVYLQIIGQTEGQDDRDVTVYNRVGDLYLRLNKTDQAVNYYEQAVDLYTDGGYLNNAIALCNKILRHAPARHQIYYKLGKISAKKGFNSDAKKNFLEFADRMHRAGKDTEAFKALQEFADLCPGQDDIRLMLADQLAKAGKTAEAIEQLQILHESLDSEGRTAEAEATVQRIRSLDPSVEPRHSKTPVKRDSGGLVFLDVGGSPAKPRPKIEGLQKTSMAPEPPRRPKTPPHVQPSPEFEALPDIEPSPEESMPALEIESTSLADPEAPLLPDIEPAFDLSINDMDVVAPLEGLESATDQSQFAIDPQAERPAPEVSGLVSAETVQSPHEPGLGEPLLDEDPLAGLNILEDDRFFVHEPVPEDNGTGPLAGATSQLGHLESLGREDVPTIETFDLDIEHPELHAHEPVAHEPHGHDTPKHEPHGHLTETEEPEEELRESEPVMHEPEPEPEPEQIEEEPEEIPEPEPAPAPVARTLRKPTPRKAPEPVVEEVEEEPEEEQEEEPEEEQEQEEDEEPQVDELEEPEEEAPPARPSKPKVVQPLRIIRPKPKKAKTPVREEAPPSPQRGPVNPFMRQRQKPKAPSPRAGQRIATPPAEIPRAATPKENAPQPATDNFVDLADWMREDRGPRSYRMVAEEDRNRQAGEEADFTDMLEKFKAGVAANVDDEDFDSHYDLGIAYKEMGLIEEAIAEFQKALRGATQRIRAYEALGQCFIDRNDFETAVTVLGRALREPGMEDEDLIGVLYLLGFASEGSKKPRDAAAYYQRVFAIDIDFRDVAKRLKQMSKAATK
ncbi:MAG TPA: tetratricopeptide repeat protein [Gemmatimonadaceae bacterium]|nr:tetratricopeptide repeat protein [Gemmatimonadaceae bacterium]